MVRKRGTARKSFAHRRVRRVKKYDHVVIPRRFKIQLPQFADRIEEALKEYVELEPYVEQELIIKGVPTNQWQYLHGFAKRMLALYLNFTGETLQKEKQSLINEYVLRGYSLNVLQQEQDVVEKYVVPPLNCAEVKACLEGNYSSWAFQWKRAYGADVPTSRLQQLMYFSETFDLLCLIDTSYAVIQRLKLSDGTFLEGVQYLGEGYFAEQKMNSVLGRYFAEVVDVGGVPTLRIWKDGSLIQSIDLQVACGWTNVNYLYLTSTSYDGKYILVNNRYYGAREYALFMGS